LQKRFRKNNDVWFTSNVFSEQWLHKGTAEVSVEAAKVFASSEIGDISVRVPGWFIKKGA